MDPLPLPFSTGKEKPCDVFVVQRELLAWLMWLEGRDEPFYVKFVRALWASGFSPDPWTAEHEI